MPDAQVIDTVDIYHLASKHRKLSLRFLSWLVLKHEIQLLVHDSVEDARMSLLLYRYYLKCVEDGTWESVLNGIYEVGRSVNFKAPN